MKERTIDIKELIIFWLKSWRVFLVCFIIGGLLSIGGIAVEILYSNNNNSTLNENNETEVKLEDLEHYLSKVEREEVDNALNLVKVYSDRISFFENLSFTNTETCSIPQIQMIFLVHAEDSEAREGLVQAFHYIVGSFDMQEYLENCDYPISKNDFSYMVVLNSTSDAVANDGVLSITVKQTDNNSCKHLAQSVKKYLDEQKSDFEQVFGEYSLELVKESQTEKYDGVIQALQYEYFTYNSEYETALRNYTKSFSVNQKRYFTYLLDKRKDASHSTKVDSSTEDIMDSEDLQIENEKKKSINGIKIYLIVLFIPTLFILFYKSVIFTLSKKMHCSDDLQRNLGIMQIGLLKSENVAKKQNFIDHFVMRMRDGKDKRSIDELRNQTTLLIKSIIMKSDEKSVCLVASELSQMSSEQVVELQKSLVKENVESEVLTDILRNEYSIRKLREIGKVILVCAVNETIYDDVIKEVYLLQKLGIDIMGYILVK